MEASLREVFIRERAVRDDSYILELGAEGARPPKATKLEPESSSTNISTQCLLLLFGHDTKAGPDPLCQSDTSNLVGEAKPRGTQQGTGAQQSHARALR